MTEGEAVSLLLYVAGAFFMPLLGGILGIPAAVAEILFGILIGKGVLQLAGEHAFLSFMSQFGFAYLMFWHFFARDALRASLPLTLVTHQPIMPLLLLHCLLNFV